MFIRQSKKMAVMSIGRALWRVTRPHCNTKTPNLLEFFWNQKRASLEALFFVVRGGAIR